MPNLRLKSAANRTWCFLVFLQFKSQAGSQQSHDRLDGAMRLQLIEYAKCTLGATKCMAIYIKSLNEQLLDNQLSSGKGIANLGRGSTSPAPDCRPALVIGSANLGSDEDPEEMRSMEDCVAKLSVT